METKVCSRCKRELPVSGFYTSKRSKDGLQSYCKDCTKQVQAARSGRADKDSPLVAFTPRELIAELRRRGYRGELRFENVIKL